MHRGILYVLDGTQPAARLVVSLYSLRNYYSGPIAVASGDATAAAICELIAADCRLNVLHVKTSVPTAVTHRRGFLLKTLVNTFSPFEASVFLDCDTLVRGSIVELFELPTPEHVLTTQFSNWGTATGLVSSRIRGWADLYPELIPPALAYGRAINTGVFSFTKKTKVFERWYHTALSAQNRFIPDEIALQLLLPHFPSVIVDQRFNCSAKFGNLTDPNTRIIHFHGRKHVGQYGRPWIEAYQEVIARNLADIQSWTPASDRRLREYLHSTQGIAP